MRKSWWFLVTVVGLWACGSGDPDDTDPDACGCAPTEICLDALCVPCATTSSVPFAASGEPLFLPLDAVDGPFEERRLLTRPVEVDGAVVLSIEGSAVQVLDETGAILSSGNVFPGGTLYLRGIAEGETKLSFMPADGCSAALSNIQARVAAAPGFAGKALTGFPFLEVARAHNVGAPIHVALDPHVFTDRVGEAFDAWLVPHRTPVEWAEDNTLDGPAVASGTVQPGSLERNLLELQAAAEGGPRLATGWDVVLDFGRDGTLDPGDLIQGFDAPGLHTVRDLASRGPHQVFTREHSRDFWNTMRIYTPDPPTEPHPLVVISHGNGHDYTWYDYLGEHLASWGYVVISHRNDTEPGVFTAAVTTYTNTTTFLADLPQLGLDGYVDPSRISWIGHSRGGEGVVLAYDKIATGAVTPPWGSAENIVLVSSIAPTIFEGPDVTNPSDATYHLLAGTSDGDVTGGVDCRFCQFFRIFLRATGERHVTYVQGADHNDFNCCGFEDSRLTGGDGPLIGRQRAQQLARSYYLALLEHHVRGEAVFEDYLGRLPSGFRPLSAQAWFTTQYLRGEHVNKLVLDDFQRNPEPEVSSAGTPVRYTVEALTEAPLDDANRRLAWEASDPMNGMTWSDGDPDPDRGVVFTFTEPSHLEIDLPADARDVRAYNWLSFRACQGTRHPETEALDDLLNFTVALVDGQGVEQGVDFGVYGRVVPPFDRTDGSPGSGWVNEFQTVRIPLSAFVADGSGLDLSDVRTVRFLFGPGHGSPRGRVGLDDIELVE